VTVDGDEVRLRTDDATIVTHELGFVSGVHGAHEAAGGGSSGVHSAPSTAARIASAAW